MTTQTKAVIYLRVSTAGQADSGLGLEAQLASCEAWAAANDCEIVATYTDAGVSGTLAPSKRNGLVLALDAVKGADVLLVAKRDRLARNMTYVGMTEAILKKTGARLVSAAGEGTDTSDPIAALFQTTMVDLFAEYEALLASVRTTAALAAKRARGEKTGGDVPYGKRVDEAGKLHAGEGAGIAARVKDLRDNEGLSYRAIAQALTEEGFTPKGKAFYASTARNLYNRKA